MAGVTLVGYSGSLVKETLHETAALVRRAMGFDDDTANGMGIDFSGGASLFGPGLVDISSMNVSMALDTAGEEPTGKPEATKVLIGKSVRSLMQMTQRLTSAPPSQQAYSLSFSRKSSPLRNSW